MTFFLLDLRTRGESLRDVISRSSPGCLNLVLIIERRVTLYLYIENGFVTERLAGIFNVCTLENYLNYLNI